MMLEERVFIQAAGLTGELEQTQENLLRLLCGAATATLAARLRAGVTPEDCEKEFLQAASLYALADFYSADQTQSIQQLKAGDLTIYQDSVKQDARVQSFRNQAQALMGPFLRDHFSFTGV